MSTHLRLLSFVMVVVSLQGCATMVVGPKQKVVVTSNPSGAVAKVDGGEMTAVTPTTFKLKRKRDHKIEFSKEGYKTVEVTLKHIVSGVVCGNVLTGGVIGVAIDAGTGAMYKLVPEKVDVTLEKT